MQTIGPASARVRQRWVLSTMAAATIGAAILAACGSGDETAIGPSSLDTLPPLTTGRKTADSTRPPATTQANSRTTDVSSTTAPPPVQTAPGQTFPPTLVIDNSPAPSPAPGEDQGEVPPEPVPVEDPTPVPTDTVAPPVEPAEPSTTVGPPPLTISTAGVCAYALVIMYENPLEGGVPSDVPSDFELGFRDFERALTDAQTLAPADYLAALQSLDTELDRYSAVYQRYGWDLSAVAAAAANDQEVADLLEDTTTLDSALATIAAFNRNSCGVDPNAP